MEQHKEQDKGSSVGRQQYVKPELIEYGHVEKLTQTGGFTTVDAHGGVKKLGT